MLDSRESVDFGQQWTKGGGTESMIKVQTNWYMFHGQGAITLQWDVTFPDTYAASRIQATTYSTGDAAERAFFDRNIQIQPFGKHLSIRPLRCSVKCSMLFSIVSVYWRYLKKNTMQSLMIYLRPFVVARLPVTLQSSIDVACRNCKTFMNVFIVLLHFLPPLYARNG